MIYAAWVRIDATVSARSYADRSAKPSSQMRLIPESASGCNTRNRFASRYQHGLGALDAPRDYKCHRGQSHTFLECTRKVTLAESNQSRELVDMYVRLKVTLDVIDYSPGLPVREAGTSLRDRPCRSIGVQVIRQNSGRHDQTAPGSPAIAFEHYQRTAQKLSGLL